MKNIFVFDIETVPDTEAAKRLLGVDGSPEEMEEKLRQYHLDITDGKNDFTRQLFHKVVAISFLVAEIHRNQDGTEQYIIKDVRSGGNIDSPEDELVKGFFNYLGKLQARIVSFNGRTFDLPVLRYRAMLHGIQTPWLYNSGDKWNSYMNRYSLDWHCDLIDGLSDYGASARIKMSEVCALLSIPCKMDMDGSEVSKYYKEGKVEDIRNYCELDVLNTYLLFLHYQHHRGALSSSNFELAQEQLQAHLGKEKAPHFESFLDEWTPKAA